MRSELKSFIITINLIIAMDLVCRNYDVSLSLSVTYPSQTNTISTDLIVQDILIISEAFLTFFELRN